MKYLVFIFVLGFLFIGQDIAFSQKKSKKIETWELRHRSTNYMYCPGFGSNCIDRVSVVIENTSEYHVSKLSIKLKITSKQGVTLYKRKHNLQVDLDPGETGASKEFKLYEKVINDADFDSDGCDFDIEILSIN